MAKRNPKKSRGQADRKDQAADSQAQENTKERPPRSLAVAQGGIRTSCDLACLFSAVICDTLNKSITVGQANVVVNAGGKILRIAEAQMRYGGMPPIKSATPFALPAAS